MDTKKAADRANTATVMVDNVAHTTETVKYDDRVVKKIIAAGLMNVDGFLGAAGGLVDSIASVLKNTTAEDETTRGIAAELKDGKVDVAIRAIVETGKSIPKIVHAMIENVTHNLKDIGGLEAKMVNVEVVDTMSRAEFEEKYMKARKPEGKAAQEATPPGDKE